MALKLKKKCTVLTEDQSSVPSTYNEKLQTPITTILGDPTPSSYLCVTQHLCACTHVCMYTHTM